MKKLNVRDDSRMLFNVLRRGRSYTSYQRAADKTQPQADKETNGSSVNLNQLGK